MKAKILIIIFIIFSSCKVIQVSQKKSVKFEIVNLNGIIQYYFENGSDKYDISDFYYPKGKVYFNNEKTYPLLHGSPLDVILYCKTDTIQNFFDVYNKNNLAFMNFEKYFSQNISSSNNSQNDIYYNSNGNEIVISFHLVGKGIIVKEICKNYLINKNVEDKECPIQLSKLKTPFIFLLEIDTVFSLEKEEQNIFQLTKAPFKSFNLGICE